MRHVNPYKRPSSSMIMMIGIIYHSKVWSQSTIKLPRPCTHPKPLDLGLPLQLARLHERERAAPPPVARPLGRQLAVNEQLRVELRLRLRQLDPVQLRLAALIHLRRR